MRYRWIVYFFIGFFCLQSLGVHQAFSDSSSLIENQKVSAFSLSGEPKRQRSIFWPAFTSLLIPGFDQFWEGQYGYAAAYLGARLAGNGMAIYSSHQILSTVSKAQMNPNLFRDHPGEFDNFKRAGQLGDYGNTLALAAGGMSAYHSFRTAVQTRDDFSFLKHHETPLELMTAPFHFSYLSRPTTYLGIPANILMGVLLAQLQGHSLNVKAGLPDPLDVAFSGGISFNAGVGEEALFRGWLMPVAMRYTNSEFSSNLLSSLVFGALHYKPGYIPLSQTLAGFYFGYLTQKNDWQLGESIFNHVWYDTIIFLVSYASANEIQRANATFYLTPITIQF
ncbi:MAG: CPBP family intramembrane glutamic endopeptidase [Bdellovibrionia bacterium]